MLNEFDFYRDERVIKRMLEYCGVPSDYTRSFQIGPNYRRYDRTQPLSSLQYLRDITECMTTEYLVGWGKNLIIEKGIEFESVNNSSFGWLLDSGLDIFRAIWDKENTLGTIDVEYYSKKFPGNIYLNPIETYLKIEPIYKCLFYILNSFGIDPLVITTGQGYHFSFKVPNYSHVASALQKLGHVESTVLKKYLTVYPWEKRKRVVPVEDGLRYDAMGKLIEYIIHKVIWLKDKFGAQLPVTIGDIAVGNQLGETINMDLSSYANPIFMRDIRLPFSTHQKHKVQVSKVGKMISQLIPLQIAIPRYTPCNKNELTLKEVMDKRRHFLNSAIYAGEITTEIPDCSIGVMNLITEYKNSKLYEFHKNFDKTYQYHPRYWEKTYDRFDLRSVPPCISAIIEKPNPYMLQPTQIQALVRTLMGSKLRWHPKHIAGLIRSKYEKDLGWEINWNKYDANMWADVWTRYYAGLIIDGTDQLIDFNCVSHQEKGSAWGNIDHCVRPNCGYNLADYR